MTPRRWLFGIGTTLALATLGAFPAQAQRGTARIYGTVVDHRTQAPLANVQIVHMGDGRSVTSDSLGLYSFDKLATGLVKFMVRAPRFPLSSFIVALTPGEQLERDIELDSVAPAPTPGGAQALPEVKVDAPASMGARYADFEHRRLTGRGQYMSGEELQRMGARRLQDVMQTFRGVLVECGGGSGCFIRMTRAPMRCLPEYIVDERLDNEFGPAVPVPDIQALEVYTGPADVPGEFAGRNAGCGLIVIWTKSGPPRAKRPPAKRSPPADSAKRPPPPPGV